MKRITKQEIEKSRQRNVWTLGKQVLYDLCAEYPDHTKDEEIIAKIWLIGRSHAAAVERRRKSKDREHVPSDVFYRDFVAPAIRQSKIDEHIVVLRGYETIDEHNPDDILKTHRYFVDVLYNPTQQNKRSLASKYLHFHLPGLFFIYDSLAYDALVQYKPDTRRLPEDSRFDKDYRKFCTLALELRQEIVQQFGVYLTPQEIDNLLLQDM